jgi:hypothetical protein
MKQKFGKYAVFDTITHHFAEEPEWYWKIKAPTSGDELAMSKFQVYNRREIGPDGVMREYPPTNTEIMHREIALTFAGTNIPADEDKTVEDGGDPIVSVKDPLETIETCLRAMPQKMVVEIWEALADAVPGWGPFRPKAEKSSPIPTQEETSTPSGTTETS